VAYAAAGPALRAHVAAQDDPRLSSAWRSVYELFKDAFGGREYE
jgi:hypothetical protein